MSKARLAWLAIATAAAVAVWLAPWTGVQAPPLADRAEPKVEAARSAGSASSSEAPGAAGEVAASVEAKPVDSTRAPSSLTLCVLERGSREPIADASVVLEETGELRTSDERRLATGSDGRASFEALPAGEYDVLVSAPQASEYRARVTVEPGRRHDLGDIELWTARPIRVAVRDERGQPLAAQVEIGAYRRGARLHELLSPRTWPTDDRGEVEIPSPTAPAFVRARVEGARLPAWSEAVAIEPPDAPERVELVVRPPTVLALRPAEQAPPNLSVQLTDPLGLVVLREPLEGGFDEPLPPGSYALELLGPDGAVSRPREVVLAGERVEVVVP
jgi:hypothetical protein